MIYLDNAATTFPKPAPVPAAVYRFMVRRGANPGRSGHKLSMQSAEEVYACRKAAARLFNAPGPECVAFTNNATYSINMALKGSLRQGAHVVVSNLEHNAVMRPLNKLKDWNVSYDAALVDLESDDVTAANFEKQLRPSTAMIACTHASNVCGRVLPIKRLGELCRERGLLFLVDASQTAGVLPIDMQDCHIDYLCLPGHKSLYGPMGTGLLITAGGEALSTLIEGGTGSNSADLNQPDLMPDRLESGTVNAPGIAGLRAGIGFVESRGIGRLYAREMRLARLLYDGLKAVRSVILYTPLPLEGYVPGVSFNIENMSSVDAVTVLDSMGFALRGGLHCSPAAHTSFGTMSQGMVRASFGAFNTAEDVKSLLAAVGKIASGAKKV